MASFLDEAALHELLSGRRRDIAAGTIRYGLALASLGYSTALRCRNLAYDKRWLTIHQAPVPVISLGNITTGGTGKTPMAAWLANWLVEHECHPGLLSRGYQSLPSQSAGTCSGANDEKLVLDRMCPGVPHVQQRDRVSAAHRLVTEFQADVLILDDGFQHRRLSRDLDLLLIDALQPWGYGHVLPRGLLREPRCGIRRADLVLLTRVDQCPSSDLTRLKQEIAAVRGAADCVEISFAPTRLVGLDGASAPISTLEARTVHAFCGIGNPLGFRRTLMSLGVASEPTIFADHYHYRADDLQKLSVAARAASADLVVTTLKDLVKIPADSWTGPPLYAIEIGVEFPAGRDTLIERLEYLVAMSSKQRESKNRSAGDLK